jgi:tripartite-type tricarboxylate transporter receptor subunit TctC
MERSSPRAYAFAVGLGAALLAFATPAAADMNLQGKTVTLYAALGVGGGGDTMARTLIPYLEKNLPGRPTIVVRNMPGGGGIQGVQYLYNVAPKDGTAFGLTPGGPIKEPLMGSSGKATYDLRKFQWIGSLGAEDSVCAVWHTSPIKSLQDARTTEVKLAATGVASNSALVPLLINDLAGTRLKPISGYDGGTSLLAVERGEMDGRCMSVASLRATRPNWITDHLVRFLFVTSESDDPDLKGVPTISALLKNDADRQALKFFEMPDEIQDPFMLPPGVSTEAVAAFRKAFDASVGNSTYLDDARRHKQTIVPHTGAEVQATIQAMYDTPQAVVERVKRATSVEVARNGAKKEKGGKKQ